MALITPTSSKVSYGTLTADTLFSCHEGIVGLTTDDAADGAQDYFWLAAGESIQIASGLTVKYIAGSSDARLHVMPAGV